MKFRNINEKCKIDKCENKSRRWEMCDKHSQRYKKYGDPLITKNPFTYKKDRDIWIRNLFDIPESDECVDWPFGVSNGYAIHGGEGKTSHLILQLSGFPRPNPPNDFALHKCDRPICVNPRHLSWGSQQENIQDAKNKGRAKLFQNGSKHPNSKLSENDVMEIRNSTLSNEELSIQFDITQRHVRKLKTGNVWTHV